MLLTPTNIPTKHHDYLVLPIVILPMCHFALSTNNYRKHSTPTITDLHNDVTYEGWDKTLMAWHRECMTPPLEQL